MTVSRSRRRYLQRGSAVKTAAVLVLVLVLLIWGSQWLIYRINHVHVVDARIKTDMVAIASRLPGWVRSIEVEEGDSVSEGQLLLAIDSSELELELAVMSGRRSVLEADAARIQAELDYARAVDRTELELAEQELAAARLKLARQKLELAKADEDLMRLQGMTANAMVSAQQLADARHLRDASQLNLKLAESQSLAAKAGRTRAEAEALRQQVLAREADVVAGRLAGLEAEEQTLKLRLRDHHLRSPVNGRVARAFVEAGEYVQTSQNLMLVFRPDRLWVEANVKETAVRKVKPGQKVSIEVDAYPGESFRGTVTRVGYAATSEFALIPSPNPSGNFTKTTQRIPLKIVFDKPDSRLRPGMMVEAGIRVGD
ncbi:HlyD family secretion protein [Marinobacter sp. F3R11]|uniref:HlyD family secretion protein n=1 Tax=Marinobacter sp. F3R11 TaxID=2267231 RepID=UPI000DE89A39|nr:HlyD family secretion protein [Marinobacter sp. F3R11]RBW51243.1 HlyD family secretion protein [Marinobacter sp. F3R11]